MRMLLCAAVAVAAVVPSTAAEAGDAFGANSAFTGTTQFVDSNRSGVRLFNDRGRRDDRRGAGETAATRRGWRLRLLWRRLGAQQQPLVRIR